MQRFSIFISFLVLMSNLSFGQHETEVNQKKLLKEAKDHVPTDSAGFYEGAPRPYSYPKTPLYKGVEKQSLYLNMRDGVALAIDIYLPKSRKAGEKFPTILHQTRYWRAPQLRFPFNLFSNGLLGRTGKMVQAFLENGYAIVNVDVRGSGASLGVQTHPWTPDEVKDGAEIMDWIIKQDWSDGIIGSMGVSYSGTAAEFLAINQHKSLKAVVLMFSLFDVFEDNAFPGGVHNNWFTSNWGHANDAMDANELPPNNKNLKFLVKGVAPVKVKGSKKMLREAICDHTENRNVHDAAITVDCRDDVPSDGFIKSVDLFSPHNYIKQLDASGVAVYSYSGYHDGAYQHSAIKRHLNLTNPHNKLILGPWEHGGAFNISPYRRSKAGFDHAGELLKFFDFHLKGKQNGLYDEPKIHYFTMGEEKWKGCDTWLPPNGKTETLFLDNKQLSAQANPTELIDSQWIDNSTTSGQINRWKAVNGKVKSPYTYYDWTERSKKLLAYETPILKQDIELTGHPILTLFVSSSMGDASLFVYLEDVDSAGNIYHITEGILRLSHRTINTDTILYQDITPNRTHLRQDMNVPKPNEIVEVKLDLLPVSNLFRKGHKLRISIAGADSEHFKTLYPKGYNLRIHRGGQYASKLEFLNYKKINP